MKISIEVPDITQTIANLTTLERKEQALQEQMTQAILVSKDSPLEQIGAYLYNYLKPILTTYPEKEWRKYCATFTSQLSLDKKDNYMYLKSRDTLYMKITPAGYFITPVTDVNEINKLIVNWPTFRDELRVKVNNYIKYSASEIQTQTNKLNKYYQNIKKFKV